jgi:23S rRNA (uracil1939-C5)-methyltransferase
VTLYEAAAEGTLSFLTGPFESVLVDPPRSGLGSKVIEQLLEFDTPKIVYVSCDPTTLARDGSQLSQAGYHLESVTPFDFFPQTYHIETVSVWRR